MKIASRRKKQIGDIVVNLNFEKMFLQLSRAIVWDMEYEKKDAPFIFLSLRRPLSLSLSSLLSYLLSLILQRCLCFPCPYSGRPSSPINSHHHPQVRLRRVNHTISESELNSMSKYGDWIMNSNQGILVLPCEREISWDAKLFQPEFV